ncbi:MAG TPA: phosphatase PAP2 family protein [Gemmatimonadales bacterium]|nr:phosphatase PAP2 family protein [Gemmatimonadales bacterium]
MIRSLVFYSLVLSAGSLAAQNVTPRYTSGWGDVAWTAGGGLVAGAALIARPPLSRCAPCDSLGLPGYERVAIRSNSSGARTVSNVLLLGIAGGVALASVTGVDRARARGNAAVMTDAVSWTVAATELLKVSIHRSRPALYRAGAATAAADPDNRESFPSGHTSLAFAAATAYTTLALRQHLPHAGRNAIVLFVAATAAGVLRVAGGKHFPSDVLAGAALGSGIGWATARLHAMEPSP